MSESSHTNTGGCAVAGKRAGEALEPSVALAAPVPWHQIGDRPVAAAYELREGLWVLGLDRFHAHRRGGHHGGSDFAEALLADFAAGLAPNDTDELPLPRFPGDEGQL